MTQTLEVRIEQLPHAQGLGLPEYATSGAAGLDLVAALPAAEPLRLEPMARALVPTGIKLALPEGYEAQIRPRSGLAARFGVTLLNSPGTIDCDYRGEVKVILVNLGGELFEVSRGLRIAQLVLARTISVVWDRVGPDGLEGTDRGEGGFGSTG